jgi:hypothetical protein
LGFKLNNHHHALTNAEACVHIAMKIFQKSEKHLPYLLYHLLEQFENIEKDYLKLISEYDKLQETANIIRNWADKNLPNTDYNFKFTETENKLLLSVSLHGRVLSIPIYYKKYKQILPQIMETITAYENIIKTTKIKVLIT